MMNRPPMPQSSQGQRPGAGAPNWLVDDGPLMPPALQPGSFWAKITGQAAGTNRYAWTQIDDGDTAAFDTGLSEDFAAAGTSDESGAPAYEINGRTDVPTGTRVRLWPAGDLTYYVFDFTGSQFHVYRVATTANITLSGEQTIDGVSVVAGDRVLVRAQTLSGDNGGYIVASGAWPRTPDSDTTEKLVGYVAVITEGVKFGKTLWQLSGTIPLSVAATLLAPMHTARQDSGTAYYVTAWTFRGGDGLRVTQPLGADTRTISIGITAATESQNGVVSTVTQRFSGNKEIRNAGPDNGANTYVYIGDTYSSPSLTAPGPYPNGSGYLVVGAGIAAQWLVFSGDVTQFGPGLSAGWSLGPVTGPNGALSLELTGASGDQPNLVNGVWVERPAGSPAKAKLVVGRNADFVLAEDSTPGPVFHTGVSTTALKAGARFVKGALVSNTGGTIGTVTEVTGGTSDGVTVGVSDGTTTPAITVTLADITPDSVDTPTITQTAASSGSTPLTITGAVGQTADLLQLKDSSGNKVLGIGIGSAAFTSASNLFKFTGTVNATVGYQINGVALAASDVGAVPSSYLDTDGTLAANSDAKVATQKAVKTYVTAAVSGLGTGTVTSVSGSGGTTGLTLTGGPITTTGTLTIGGTLAIANGGTGAASASAARTALGLAIGSDVQAYDADLDALAALSATAGLVSRTGAGAFAVRTLTAPAAGITVSNGTGAAGNPTLALADDLAAVEALSGTGPVKRTGTSTWTTAAIDLSGSEVTGTLAAARMPALTGDVTTSAGAVATTLANSGVSAGTYTLATVTVDAKGRVTSASSGAAPPSQNLLHNGGFEVWQRGTSLPGLADAVYGADRWIVINEGGGAYTDVSRQTGSQLCRYAMRVTQNNGVGYRVGVLQFVETADTYPRRGQTVRLQFQVRANTTRTIRYAIVEWTGTADTPTRDLVNTWTSTTYTPGNFFISSNLNVLAVGSASATTSFAAVTALTATVGASANNLAVIAWSESGTPQNGYFEIAEVGLYDGSGAQSWLPRPCQQELALCQRYFYAVAGYPMGTAVSAAALSSMGALSFPVTMRAAPSMVAGATFAANAGNAGTVSLYAATVNAASFTNGSANWTTLAIVTLTASFTAEL